MANVVGRECDCRRTPHLKRSFTSSRPGPGLCSARPRLVLAHCCLFVPLVESDGQLWWAAAPGSTPAQRLKGENPWRGRHGAARHKPAERRARHRTTSAEALQHGLQVGATNSGRTAWATRESREGGRARAYDGRPCARGRLALTLGMRMCDSHDLRPPRGPH